MLLGGKTLFVAGPPDVFAYGCEDIADPYHVAAVEALREQEAAWDGKRGGLLLAVSAADGEKLAEYKLDAPPEWDGMATARGRLYLALTDGKVVCIEKRPD